MKLIKILYMKNALFPDDPQIINVNIIDMFWSEVELGDKKITILNEDLFAFYEEYKNEKI